MKKKICFVGFIMFALLSVWAESNDEALIRAAREQDYSLLEYTLSYTDVNPNYLEKNSGKTALMIAAGKGWDEGVRLLLSHSKINPNYRNTAGQTALMLALRDANSDSIVRLLMDYNTNVNDRDNAGKTLLMYAAANKSDNILTFILADPNVGLILTDKNNWTALMYAAYNGSETAFKRLLHIPLVKTSADMQDIDGNNAFMLAVTQGHTNIVRILVNTDGFDINKRINDEKPVLFWAIEKNKSEKMIEFIMRNYDPDVLVTTKDYKNRDIYWYIKQYKNKYAAKVLKDILD